MSARAPVTANHFVEATSNFRLWLEELDRDLRGWQTAKQEWYQQFKGQALERLAQAPQRLRAFRRASRTLPGNVKQRESVKKTLKELDRFEDRFAALSKRLSMWYNNHKIEGACENALGQMRTQLGTLQANMNALLDHPLIGHYDREEVSLAEKHNLQWGRKIGHAMMGLTFLYLIAYSPLPHALVMGIFMAFVVWAIALESARHMSPRVNVWVCRVFGPVMREREKTRINSGIYYILAMSLVYFVFPLNVAILTMLFIALGDTVAGIVGVKFGRHKIAPHVSLEGVVACFATCSILTLFANEFLLSDFSLSGLRLFLFVLLGGVIGAASESSFKQLDDNLVMPLLSAPFLWLAMRILG